MPLISVLLPTRNRAHLLRYALQSVLRQDFDDYEAVVSDNVSADGTKDLIASFADPHIRYIQPPEYLRACDHWNFAIRHIQGKYMLLTADDDCLAPNALRSFADAAQKTQAQIIGCQSAEYFAPDFRFPSQRNTFISPAFRGGVEKMEMRRLLQECFSLNLAYYPRVPTLIAREIVETVLSRFGYFFALPFPEYVGYAMAFSLAQEFVKIDKPLVVVGRTPDSLGPNYFWFGGDPSWAEVGNMIFQNVPLQGTFVTNGIGESFMKAKKNLPENFRGIELAYDKYYSGYYADMLAQQKLGRDIRREMDEYQRVVVTLPVELRDRVKALQRSTDRRRTWWFQSLSRAKQASLRVAAAAQTRTVAQRRDFSKGGFVRGEEVGVQDILGCGEWLAQIAGNGTRDEQ